MPLGRYEGLMGLPMSTMGQKQTLRGIRSMSESGHWMRGWHVRFAPKQTSQSAARRTVEGPVLTEIGKPMLGIESGKNFPARMAGCSFSNDWPLAYA